MLTTPGKKGGCLHVHSYNYSMEKGFVDQINTTENLWKIGKKSTVV